MTILYRKWQDSTSNQKLFLILLLAFTARITSLLLEAYITRDATLYLRLGAKINSKGFKEGVEICKWLPPLFPLICSIPEKLNLPPEKTLQFTFILINTLAIIPVFKLTKMMTNGKVARICAFIISLHPEFIEVSYKINREAIYLPTIIFSIFFTFKGIRTKHFPSTAYAGIFCGLAYVTRHESFELIISLFCMALVSLFINRENLKNNVIIFLVTTTTFIFTIIPFALITKDSKSEWKVFPTKKIEYILRHAGFNLKSGNKK